MLLTMRDKALEPAYMFPTNRREPGSQERAADLKQNIQTYQTKLLTEQLNINPTVV